MSFLGNVDELNYTIEKTTSKDDVLILDFIKKHFYKDAPLISTLELGETVEIQTWAENTVKKCINYSFKAVDENDKIIGISLNRMQYKSTHCQQAFSAEIVEDQKQQLTSFDKLQKFLQHIDDSYNIFEKYPNQDRALHLNILCIDTNYRRKGIATELMKTTFDSMKKVGVSLCDIMCTNYYSAAICEKMHLTEMFRIAYKDYKINDEIVICPREPNKFVKIFLIESK